MCVFFLNKKKMDQIELELRVLELEGQIKINKETCFYPFLEDG